MPAFLKRQQCQDILIKVSFYYQHNILYVRYAQFPLLYQKYNEADITRT